MARPVTVKHRTLAAQEVAYLPTLYDHLLHDRMLAAFYAKCDAFAAFYDTNGDDVDVGYEVCTNSNGGVASLDGRMAIECAVDLDTLCANRCRS